MVLCLLLLFLHCGGKELVRRTEDNPDAVYWSETCMLSRDGFQGTPILGNPDMASEIVIRTPSAIERKSLLAKTRLIADCYMDKKSSWVDRKNATGELLFYNQVIFDIYELYTCKLRQAFMSPDFDMNDAVETFNRLVAENSRALEARVRQYQNESQRGRNAAVTRQWFRQIRAEMGKVADR